MGSDSNSSRTPPALPDSEPYLLLNRQRKHRVDRGELVDFLGRLVSHLQLCDPFSVVLVSDPVMRTYNDKYRHFDKATDVLSFPGDTGYLGDVVISTETAHTQALGSKTLDFDMNLKRLALHGILHLMGHDHEDDDGEMRSIERRLRRRFEC
jgi:probable rRNA maturation factor